MSATEESNASSPDDTQRRTGTKKRKGVLSPKRAVGRLLISAILGVTALLVFTPTRIEWWVRAVVAWDVGSLALTALAWNVILRATPESTKKRCASDDPGRATVFAIALGSSLFSLFAAAFVLRRVKSYPEAEQLTWTLLTLVAIALAWVVTHTAYTMRYAHLYYRKPRADCAAGGLQFPGDRPPADIDFAYFSFTIGMCFQVSDIVVTASRVRRAVLLHAVLSFVYNTSILALALNLVLGMMG